MQASSARARTKGAGRRKVFAAALAASAFTAGAAGAADVDSVDDCRKDATLSISGQVNRAFLYADNGTVDDLFFVDNNNSSTRLRFRAVGRIDCDLKLGAQIEVQFRSNSTRFIRFKQDGDPGPDNFTQRKMEIWLDSETWGQLWLGQGDTASNGTSEMDLSGTGVIGYSDVGEIAAGLEFDNGVRIRNASDNFDGIGRRDRVRYDTPTFSGFTASASYSDRNWWDVALRFADEFDTFTIASAIAYAQPDTSAGGPYDYQVNGSASVLFSNGLNLTIAGGFQENRTGGRGAVTDPYFLYGKVGWILDLIDWGQTAVAVDFQFTSERDAQGEEFYGYGAFIVQNLEWLGTDLYAGFRYMQLKNDTAVALPVPGTFFPATTNANPGDITAVMVGARVKF